MINQYGADAVRLFILSDSPPEKDIQWSDTGVESANKFLQKIWNLNYLICARKENGLDLIIEKKFISKTNNFVNKIDDSIKNFRFNVSIAYFHQVYKMFRDDLNLKISNKVLRENAIKIIKLMVPFTPHLSFECLELLECKTVNNWPQIDKKNTIEEINMAVQINGKTRDVITIKIDSAEKEITQFIIINSKAKKYIQNKKKLIKLYLLKIKL